MSALINGVRCTEDACDGKGLHRHGIDCDRDCICGRGFFTAPVPAARHMALAAQPAARTGWFRRLLGGKK